MSLSAGHNPFSIDFSRFRPGGIVISSITLAELEYGAARSTQPRKNREALDQFVSAPEVNAFGPEAEFGFRSLVAKIAISILNPRFSFFSASSAPLRLRFSFRSLDTPYPLKYQWLKLQRRST